MLRLKNINITNRGAHKLLLLFAIFNIFVTNSASSQFYTLGSDPAKAKWRKLETENYRVIYPVIADSLAQRYAYLLEALREPVMRSINSNPKKTDVVLHPYSVISNGMVGVAPKRIELITRAPANDDYINNWDKHLIIHELRHLGQITKFEKGVFKPLSWLIGEQATAIGAGVFMSRWRLEGDAVVSETELTSAGRGRDPGHLKFYRAAFLEGDYRSWNRWTMGSYRDFVPDVYSFGYMFCSFIRFNSGNYNAQGESLEYIVSRFYDINADNKAYKKYTSLSKKENFSEMKRVMTAKWQRDDSARAPFTPFKLINPPKREYTSYTDPLFFGENSVLAIKKDLERVPRLVEIKESSDEPGVFDEKVIKHMGRVSSPPLLYKESLFWTEYIQSARWELESYSDIFSYNLISGKSERHTKGESFFNPSFCSDGESVLVISYPVDGSSNLSILSTEEFTLKKVIPSPNNGQLKEAVMLNGVIYATAANDIGLGLYRFNNSSEKWETEIAPQSKNINHLRSSGDELWFISGLDGLNNVYIYNPDLKLLRQLTNSRFDITSLSVCEESDSFLYSDYTHLGYNIVKAHKDSMIWKISSFSNPSKDEIADYLSIGAGFNADTLSVPNGVRYPSQRFRKGLNLIKIHSWAPVFYNIDNIKNLTYDNIYDIVSPGVILYSQNALGTADAMAGYSWKRGSHSGYLNLSYRGLFPVIELKADINTRERYKLSLSSSQGSQPIQVRDTLPGSPYLSTQLLLYAPLRFNREGWSSGVIPGFLWRFTNDSFYSHKRERYSNYQYLNFRVSLYRVLNRSHRDHFPRVGAGLNLQFSTLPFSGENFGSLFYSSMYAFFPGLISGHGMRLAFAFQKQLFEGKNYLLTNVISFPRGVMERDSRLATSLTFEYALPLVTKDMSISSLLYIKRVMLVPFSQILYNRGIQTDERFFSYGGDLLFDVNLFGISYPLSLGVRVGATSEKRAFAEFLFKTPL